MFSASVKAILRTYQLHKDGTADVMIQVIIDRQKTKINTGIRWDPKFWDSGQSFCLKRTKNDTLANDNNIEIRNAISRANDIFFFYRSAYKQLTIKQFVHDYQNYYDKSDFLAFMEREIEKQVSMGIIERGTANTHRRTLQVLRQFKPQLLMTDLVKTLPREFDAWMKKYHTKNVNTRSKEHKNFRTYVNRAIDEGHDRVPKIYKGFTLLQVPAQDRALTDEELQRVVEYYLKCTEPHKLRVLRRFLFSCFTSLRISDLMRIEPSWLYENNLVFVAHKTRNRKPEKTVVILSPTALKLFKEEVESNHPKGMFNFPTPQVGNRILSKIGEELSIGTKLTSKTGRKTCATLIVKNTGDLHAAKEFLNHSDIKTTMRYDYVDMSRKVRAANAIEELLGKALKGE